MSKRSFSRGVLAFGAAIAAILVHAQAPVPGPNINMVSGTKWPQGDPFLTKQNEPSIAVSSRNARHLMAGANDYRLVPVEIAEQLDDPEAWVQIFKSVDGGQTWRGTPLGGCPLSIPECTDSTGLTAKLLGYHPNFGADPTVRAGPYGTFFLSFIAGTRDSSANGVVAVQRFVDKNNDIQRSTDVRPCTQGTPGCQLVTIPNGCTGSPPACTTQYLALKPAQDPILPDVLNIIDVGTPGQGKDKPWLAADVGGRSWNAGKTCELLSWTKSKPGLVTPASEPNVPAFNVYVTYANFQGNSSQPDIYASVSKDCGTTFAKPVKLTSGASKNQGTSSAIDPLTGAVYVVWRQFANPSAKPPLPDAIMMSKSTDGGATWNAGKVPTQIATLKPYDQGATGVSMRTLGFPSVAVSVSGGVSRVHVAWTQRTAAPNATPPYACPAADPAQCDARIVVATSKDGGVTWPAAVPVDSGYTVNLNLPNGSVYSHNRGHQFQPTLTFAAGKLLVTWLDSRLDQSEGYLTCKPSAPGCTSVSDMVESRRPAKNSNLDPACHIDVTSPPLSTLPAATKALYDHCNHPEAVWTPYVTDGTTGLVRRHTVDVYSAMADPADAPAFTSSRVSQYTFGTTVQSDPNVPVPPGGAITPRQGIYDIVQKEVNAPNLPMFSAGKSAFMGDYIDSAGQLIVATGDPQRPYKFNVGGGASGAFVTSGFAPAFQVAFTDNRDVIPPLSGDWSSPSCLTTAFKKDANGNIIGVDTSGGAACQSGYSGNRNQNVYTAAIVAHSVAFANANSKALDATTERAYSVTVRNLSTDPHNYQLTLVPGPGTTASFHSATPLTQNIIVQPRSSSARTVWVKGSSTGSVEVDVKSTDSSWVPDGAFATKVLLNPDPTAPLVANGDGGPANTDTAPDNFGNVVMTNAVMTNYLLANNPLTTAVMSNNAMTNAAMSNVVFSNAAMSNDPTVNAAMSNVVMSNAVMSNNAMTNAVMSNVVMTNNTLNAAMTNVDPANVAMSNAVMSNNAMTNVALTNNDPSNVVMTNNAMTNAVMSNVAMSNVAMSNNAMTNDPLRYAVMTNAPLSDPSGGTVPDADPLRSVEVGNVEIAQNPFRSGDLANSNFKETTFAIRNRGNVDTTVAIKMVLRDAICSGNTGVPATSYICTTPPGYKLQLVLRKVSMVPVAIPPTGPATSTGRAIRIGFTQSNVEVSNVSDLPLIDPSDPNFGKFLPDDPKAAMLTLAPGDYAYAVIRAIGVTGFGPVPDPADLLQWGVQTVASNATNANGPLLIRTLNFPASPAFIALTPASPTLQTFGGTAPIAGSVACSDKFGNIVLSGTGAPTGSVGVDGNLYVDTPAQMVYGPKTLGNWGSATPLIQPPDANHPTPWASVACPPGPFGTALAIGAFTTDASFNSTATITFKPTYWGDFYIRAGVTDASSPQQTDQQVIKVHVNPRPPALDISAIPAQLTYNQGISLLSFVTSDSKNGAGTPQPFVFDATSVNGSCHVVPGTDTLVVDHATIPVGGAPDCVVTVHQDGNEIYAPVTSQTSIYINQASQTVVVDTIPSTLTYNNFGNPAATLTAHVTSTTAPNSGLAVTFTSLTTGVCTTGGANGAQITILSAGTCTIQADQAGNRDYQAATPFVPPNITINRADQNIALIAPASAQYNASFMVSATSTSPTAPPSGISITFGSATPSICTIAGTTVSIVTVGTCRITADQLGSPNYNPAPQAFKDITITKADQNIGFGGAPSLTFGDSPGTVSATSTSPTAPPSGTPIIFSSQTTGVCTTGGVNGSTVTIVAAGSCTIAANQAASTNYNAAPQVTQMFSIAKAPTTITAAAQFFTPLGTPSTLNGSVARTSMSTVFPSSGSVSISVQGVNGSSKNFTPSVVSGAFTVSDGAPLLVSDSYNLTFSYAGDSNFAAATNIVSSLRVEGFSAAANMNLARAGHTSTLLQDGNVLVAGGVQVIGNAPTNRAEVYCAATSATGVPCSAADGSFQALVPTMATSRYGFTSTLLGDGTVLIAGGGIDNAGTPTPKAELFCAVTPPTGPCATPTPVNTFVPLAGMGTARAGHAATRLPDGTVLVTGGYDTSTLPVATAEVYCAAISAAGGPCAAADYTFKPTAAPMGTARDSHTSTLLPDGTVLVAGGEIDGLGTQTNTAEIYCSAAAGPCGTADGKFKPTSNLMSSERSVHTATMLLLGDGRVLVAGGYDLTDKPTVSNDTYCPSALPGFCTGNAIKFVSVGDLKTARANQTASLLTDGWALLVGGRDTGGVQLATSELFDPGANLSALGASMATARSGHAATRLQDGRVLVTGGSTPPNTVVNSAELYNGP